jgi:bacteriorhodopsin
MNKYKVELTEGEAKTLGYLRWKKEKDRGYFRGTLIAAGVMVVCAVLAGIYNETPRWAFLVPFAIAGMAVLYFPTRLEYLASKAGREFVQSLKKET